MPNLTNLPGRLARSLAWVFIPYSSLLRKAVEPFDGVFEALSYHQR